MESITDNIKIDVTDKDGSNKVKIYNNIGGEWRLIGSPDLKPKTLMKDVESVEYMEGIRKVIKQRTDLSTKEIGSILSNLSMTLLEFKEHNPVVDDKPTWMNELDDATEIYQSGKAMETILGACESHRGDDLLKKMYILSMVAPYVVNSRSIWMFLQGDPGIGKSGSIRTAIKTNPFAYERQFSSLGMYYFDINEGDTIYFDDSKWTDDMVAILKQYDWKIGLDRTSVQEHEGHDLHLPPHVNIFGTSNFVIEDPGLKDRFWYHIYNDNKDRQENSFAGIIESFDKKDDEDLSNIYSIWQVLKNSKRFVQQGDDIEGYLYLDDKRRRYNQMFISVSLCIAFINNHDTVTKFDLNETMVIMSYMVEKSDNKNDKIICACIKDRWMSQRDIVLETGLEQSTVSRRLKRMVRNQIINKDGDEFAYWVNFDF